MNKKVYVKESVSVNLFSYCDNFVNLYIFNLTNVGDFGIFFFFWLLIQDRISTLA